MTSATLERARFPRLARVHQPVEPLVVAGQAAAQATQPADNGLAELHDTWHHAKRDRDLHTGRLTLDALRAHCSPQTISTLEAELDSIAAEKETALRAAFGHRVRNMDYAGALSVGADIRRHLPHRPIARDFERIEPVLREKLNNGGDTPPDPKNQGSSKKASA